ncbi:MAG: alpha-mannosidase [Oscillospiraceae bacterium]|nr:alpha-mannosidase [Oscillospiraceae bacterium]
MDNKIHLIANAHLDPIWLWRWQEGCAEVLQTFRSALDRIKEYPYFIFTCSSASYYRWVEEIDPGMFEEIKQRVKEGRWVPVGGWNVQADCNMPSGESFARQALYSQLYYHKNFGITCQTGYCVDSFGHNGNLPQLLAKGGMFNYVMMRPSVQENPDMPQNTFWWEGTDGSRVLVYRIPTSYAETGIFNLDKKTAFLEERIDKTGHDMALFYGFGNHGGGPSRGDIEFLKSISMREGRAALEFSSPDDYFTDILNTMVDMPVWKDELQHHASGCYSSTSLVKQLNRKAENLLEAAEKFSTIAAVTAGGAPKTAEFEEAYNDVCFNQFHDILCGCSIREAYDDVRDSMGKAMTIGDRAYNAAILQIARRIDTWLPGVSDPVCTEVRHYSHNPDFPRPVVVFNPLSWDIEVPVRTLRGSGEVKGPDGEEALCQHVRSSRSNDSHQDTVFLAKVPAMGYATYWLTDNNSDEEMFTVDSSKPLILENEHIKAEFDEKTGGIKNLVNKEDGRDFAEGGILALPTVIRDEEADTWAHGIFKFHDIKGAMALESIERIEDGPVREAIRIRHKFNESYLEQEFILGKGQKTLRVRCKAMWQEDFTMLKMPFDIGGAEETSTYEIPGGFIKRPCNGEEEPAQRWADITTLDGAGRRGGLAVINDSKYSYDCPETNLRLTMLRNVIFSDHFSFRPGTGFNFTDEGLQRFEYGVYLHTGEVEASDVAREAAQFNIRPAVVPESYHKGAGEPLKKSFFFVDSPNVCVNALKFCEDGSGDIVARIYETKGVPVKAMIKCDMVSAAFWADFQRNEIKTFRIDKDGFAREVNFLEGIV